MKNTTSLFCRHRRAVLCLLALFAIPTALAETITIGKGKGILWEGLPFNMALSDTPGLREMVPKYGLLAITDPIAHGCMVSSKLKTIQEYEAWEITPGVGLIPKATGYVTYKVNDSGNWKTLSGTIGLPNTIGSGSYGKTTPPNGYSWCLPPKNNHDANFYDTRIERSVTIAGTWVLVADGTQKTAEITLPKMVAASYTATSGANLTKSILPSDITLRVSTLECTVNTPTSIAFGRVPKDTQAGAELAALSYPLITTCGQKSDFIDANISLQFRQLSGLYNNAPTRLALNKDGGYITGEIDNGVTGSGSCTATTGLPFDDTELKVGNITQAQTSATFSHQVTWRLCSGGQDLPLGDVSAAAEMLVTFN